MSLTENTERLHRPDRIQYPSGLAPSETAGPAKVVAAVPTGCALSFRVMQTKFGLEGNCFDACLASLLGIPLKEVNYFNKEDTWYSDLQRWLAPRNLAYVEIDCADKTPLYRFPLPVLAIAGGPSPRGVEGGHACVVELHRWDKRIVHDPHPDGTGLEAIKSVGLLVWQPTQHNSGSQPCRKPSTETNET